MANQYRINHQIRAKELRVLDDEGNNYGILSHTDALIKAEEMGMDLIEISPNAIPPVAKIMDFGKFQYLENKKAKVAKARTSTVELKTVQIKVGTGDHDLELKAKRVSEWLAEGNRVKIDLFLPGRTKYMQLDFLKERLNRVLAFITTEYKVAGDPVKSPKGLTVIVEKKGK